MLNCNMFQVTYCKVLCIAVFRKSIYREVPLEMDLDESCHIGFMGKKEKENKPIIPAPANL